MDKLASITINKKKFYFMQLWGDCSNLGYLGRDRDKGPIDNVYSVKAENITLLLENKYLDLILNTTPKECPRYKNFDGDSNVEYDYGTVKILHNNPKEEKYKQELKLRIERFNCFYENLKIKENYFFTINFNDELVFQSSNTLKGSTFLEIIEILNKYNILEKTIFVGLNKGATFWASNMHLADINSYIEKYKLKYIEIFENDIWKTEKVQVQFKQQFEHGLKTGNWIIERKTLFPTITKCFGIISWLPDKEPDRTQRKERINRLFKQLENLWPDIPILVIAQNWKNFKPVNTKNPQLIKEYEPLGILKARKTLRQEFLNTEFKYIIMFDDDAIIECANKDLPKKYLAEIDAHPLGFAFLKGKNNIYNPYAAAQLNLCAISRAIYEQEDMVDIDPQKGEGFEDCVFATLLHYKYSQYEFDIPSGLTHSQYFNTKEKVPSTWWADAKSSGISKGLIQRTNALCKYISEKKKLPPDLKQFLKNYDSINYRIEKTIVPKAEAFTGLTEEWWKEDF